MNAANHSYVAALKCNTGNLTMLSGSTRKKGIEFYGSETVENHYEKYNI